MEYSMDNTNKYVRMSMESGVPPLELRFSVVNGVSDMLPMAYRGRAVINSIILGKIEEDDYESSMTLSPIGCKLAEWGLRETVKLIKRMEEDLKIFEWISFKCLPTFLIKGDVYNIVKDLLDEFDLDDPKHLCLEFPNTILLENLEKVEEVLLDLKILGVRVLMSGAAADNCPLQSLAALDIDMVVIDESVNETLENKRTAKVLPALVEYLRSMKVEPIVSGIKSDSQLEIITNNTEVYGFVPSKDYDGNGSTEAVHYVVTSTGEELLELKE